jgi:single-strand DNA-binding protein
MSSYNRITLVGNAGRDAEMSFTTSGTAVTKFSLAVNDYNGKDDKGDRQYKTTWFNVIAWNGLAETANTLIHKGATYLVAGRLVLRDYTDKEGQKRTSVEVVASEIVPLSKKSDTDTSASYTADLGELDDHPF